MGEAEVLARADGIRGRDARSNAAIECLMWTDVYLRRRQAGYRSLPRRPRTREYRLRLVGVFAGSNPSRPPTSCSEDRFFSVATSRSTGS